MLKVSKPQNQSENQHTHKRCLETVKNHNNNNNNKKKTEKKIYVISIYNTNIRIHEILVKHVTKVHFTPYYDLSFLRF